MQTHWTVQVPPHGLMQVLPQFPVQVSLVPPGHVAVQVFVVCVGAHAVAGGFVGQSSLIISFL